MRTLFVGDVHGHDQWHEPVADALARGCYVVFIGDYLDSFTIDGVSIYDNLTDILELKTKYPDRITLLLGNHEYVYMMNKTATTSGGNEVMAADYYHLLNSNWHLFDLAWGYQSDNRYLLATHAGLTNQYYEKFILPEIEGNGSIGSVIRMEEKGTPELDGINYRWPKTLLLHEKLNYFKDKFSILWEVGMRTAFPTGPGSIIWADKVELVTDAYKGIDQIVGHTAGWSIEARNSNSNTLWFINLKESVTVGTILMEL